MTVGTIKTTDEMIKAGATAASQAKSGQVFALVGDLGAGKTHWSKGFIQQLDANATPNSPTFSIVNEYREGSIPVFHFDFYRIENPEELINLGWDEYLDEDGILICEWANLFPELMPDHTVWVKIHHLSDSSRELTSHSSPPES